MPHAVQANLSTVKEPKALLLVAVGVAVLVDAKRRSLRRKNLREIYLNQETCQICMNKNLIQLWIHTLILSLKRHVAFWKQRAQKMLLLVLSIDLLRMS